jgi:hypothetical protein
MAGSSTRITGTWLTAIARHPHVAQSKTVDSVFVAQSAASLGASSAEQFYVSVSRARDSVTVYTDDKARLAESIQSSGARMTAHELLKVPSSANAIDPFESMLREKGVKSIPPDLKQEKEHPGEKNRPAAVPRQNQQINPFEFFEPGQPRQGISL